MKHLFKLTVCVLFFSALQLQAEENSTTLNVSDFSLTISTGYQDGLLRELVYYQGAPTLLSELSWRLGRNLMMGATTSMTLQKWLWLHFAFYTPIPLDDATNSKKMVDLDWIPENGIPPDTPNRESWHQLQTLFSFQWQAALGADLFPQQETDLIFGLSTGFIFWNWLDRARRLFYAAPAKEGINYQINLWSIGAFIRFQSPPIKDTISFSTMIFYSPYTTWVGYDSHLARNQLFRDTGDGAHLLRATLEGEIKVYSNIYLTSAIIITTMFENQGYGDTFNLEDGEKLRDALSRSKDDSDTNVGLSYFSYQFNFGVKILFNT